LIAEINHHPLYAQIRTLADLRLFMENHVFCVWDFMCLLKELQRQLVSTQAPWFPPRDAASAHLINSILVEEEGDLMADGKNYACHFDLYRAAMQQIGADTQPVQHFLNDLKQGRSLAVALQQASVPLLAREFITHTFSFFTRSTPEIAAAFVYGREAITAKMFLPLIDQLKTALPLKQQSQLSSLIYYFQRHIELDQSDHLPKAMRMLVNLINEDEQNQSAVLIAATQALQARLDLLTGIQQIIENNRNRLTRGS
jgi:Protein of unknown function (DUF3050)